jgi:hypothetical protein
MYGGLHKIEKTFRCYIGRRCSQNKITKGQEVVQPTTVRREKILLSCGTISLSCSIMNFGPRMLRALSRGGQKIGGCRKHLSERKDNIIWIMSGTAGKVFRFQGDALV